MGSQNFKIFFVFEELAANIASCQLRVKYYYGSNNNRAIIIAITITTIPWQVMLSYITVQFKHRLEYSSIIEIKLLDQHQHLKTAKWDTAIKTKPKKNRKFSKHVLYDTKFEVIFFQYTHTHLGEGTYTHTHTKSVESVCCRGQCCGRVD